MIRLLVLIAVAATYTLLGADVSGNWGGVMETNGRPVPIYLKLNQNVYGVFGTLVTINDKRQMPIKKAQLRADELTFEIGDNADRLVTFRLKLSDTKMTG